MKVLFDETQRLRANPWIWVMLVVSFLAAVIPIGMRAYDELARGVNWEDTPLTGGSFIAMIVAVVAIGLIGSSLIFFTVLETRVDETSISYRFYPHIPKWKKIDRNAIESFGIRKLSWLEAGQSARKNS